ncbi:MAG: hypothetical protein QM775_20835 [Pirellulales bacterium]
MKLFAKRNFIGEVIGWFIRVVIYDICISTIQMTLGVSRMVALLIFLGILAVIAFAGYFLKQKYAPGVESDD